MIITPEKIKGYAFCRNPTCAGYGQEELDVVRTTVAYTYGDNGADMFKSTVERSTSTLEFADPEDAPCRSCGNARELSEQPRPAYAPMSGHDPMGLVNGSLPGFDPNRVNTEADARVAALEAQMAQMSALLKAALGEPED